MQMPYTEALFQSIPKLDAPSHSRLVSISGRPPDLAKPLVGCRFFERCRYAQPRCAVEEPPLQQAETADHHFACWYPVGRDAGEQAVAVDVGTPRAPKGSRA
jgi:peptide/nickel transport system ATP-binding protein